MLALGSCHEQSDTLVNYAHEDVLAFGEAEKSYAGKFKVLKKAMRASSRYCGMV